MSVTKIKETRWLIECDTCRNKSHHTYEAPTELEDTITSVLRRNWYLADDVHLCPTCDHGSLPHWRQHADAVDAAVRQASRTEWRFRVTRCRCQLWTIRKIEESWNE